jgi:hypothetical protein
MSRKVSGGFGNPLKFCTSMYVTSALHTIESCKLQPMNLASVKSASLRIALARIIHHPKNRSEKGFLKPSEASKHLYPRLVTLPKAGGQIVLTLCQAVEWARSDALALSQPAGAASPAEPVSRLGSLDRTRRTCETRRTQAQKVKLRLKSGATGHDEGNDIVRRSVNSGTRAPSLSTRSWMVSIVAQAHGAVLNTSRRKVSSHP